MANWPFCDNKFEEDKPFFANTTGRPTVVMPECNMISLGSRFVAPVLTAPTNRQVAEGLTGDIDAILLLIDV